MSDGSYDLLALVERLLRDPALQEKFLPRVTEAEIATIRANLPGLVENGVRWSERWSQLPPTALVPICIQACIQLGHVGEAAMLTHVKCALWLYAIDDVVDGALLEMGPLEETFTECLRAASGWLPGVAASELARALAEIREELTRLHGYHLLYSFWLVSLVRVCEGMMYEYFLARRVRQRPGEVHCSAAEYMHFTRFSIAVPTMWIICLIGEPDDSIGEWLDPLNSLVEQCGVLVRLANDVATYEREAPLGIVNAVGIRMQEAGNSEGAASAEERVKRAKHDIRQMILAESMEMRRMAQEIHTSTGVERRLVRGTEFAVDLYLGQDFRVWERELAGDLRVHRES